MSKSKLRLVLTAFVALAFSFGLAACGGDDDDDEGDGAAAEITGGEETLELTIGDSLPLTGDLADFGPPGEKAADLAVDQINAAIEEVGADHTVEIIHEDNETNPQAAVQAARSMVADGATCITGAWASADTIPTARSVSIREGILQISPASTSDEITPLEDDGLLNRTAPPDSFQGPTLANYMDEVLGGAEGTTVNIGARNDAYGEGLAGTFSAAWEELGGQIGEEVIYEVEQPNYDSEAQQIASGNPDATVIIDFSDAYPRVGPALARAGVDFSTTFGTDGLASSSLPQDAGEESTEGMRGTAPGSPDEETQTVAFDELYTESEPTDVERQTFDSQNFDAVILCYLAAVAAGSTEGADMAEVLQTISSPGGTEYTWEELPDAVEALQNGDDIDYVGASGAIDIDENGDATAGVYDIWEYRNGQFELTDEVPVAQPN
jgi:ABC-type branched-subunit amino acid transport system substrate-binding protein